MNRWTVLVRKNGNSLKITIPYEFAQTNDIQKDDIVFWVQDKHGVHLEFAETERRELVLPEPLVAAE